MNLINHALMIFPFYVRQLNLCNKRFSILCSVFVLLASSWKEGEKGTPSIYIYIYPNCRLSCSGYFSCYYLGRMLENMLFYRTLIPWDAGIIWSHDFSPFLDLLKPPNQRTNYDKPGNKKKNHTPNYLNSESLNFWSPKPKVWLITRTN